MRSNVSNISSLLASGGRTAVSLPADEGEACEYEAFAHGRVGNRAQLMVVFRKASGEVVALSYLTLIEVRSANPEKGCTLDFGSQKIVIVGERLENLFRYLVAHKAAEILEADRTMAFQGEASAPVVTSIQISK